MKTKWRIVAAVLLGCAVMSFVDGVVRPGYVVKSLVKLAVFIGLPLLCARGEGELDLRALFRASRRGVLTALGLGLAVYAVVVMPTSRK